MLTNLFHLILVSLTLLNNLANAEGTTKPPTTSSSTSTSMSAVPDPECGRDEIRCPFSVPDECVFQEWLCDGEWDCVDGGDELEFDCENFVSPLCARANYVPCPERPALCVPKTWICNGSYDCPEGGDELGCENYIIGHNYHGLYCHGHKFSRT